MTSRDALKELAEEWTRRVVAGEDPPSLVDTLQAAGVRCLLPGVCGKDDGWGGMRICFNCGKGPKR